MRRKDDITLTGETDRGTFLVAHVTREGGYFSVTADEYASRRAFELGNDWAVIACGRLDEDIRELFPQLKIVQDVILCNSVSGEPGHARSNGWYYLGGAAAEREMEYQRKGSKNWGDAPDPYSVEWTPYWKQKAANALHCEAAELPDTQDEDEFKFWVNTVMVPRWRHAADRANEFIDANRNEIEIPSEQSDEPTFSVELDDGLKVHASLFDEVDSDILPGRWVNQYKVIVRTDDYTYEAKFHGSVADYEEGIVNAREAAFGTLRELSGFLYESAQEVAESCFEEGWDGLDEETRKALLKCERAADAMSRQLEANMEVIGS